MLRFAGQYDNTLHLFCNEPEEKSKLLNLVRPFTPEVWISFLVALLFVTAVLAAVRQLQQWLLPADAVDHTTNYPSFLIIFGAVFNEIRYY